MFENTSEFRRKRWVHLGAPATSLGAPQIAIEQSGNFIISCENTAGTPENHNYY